MPTTAKKIPAVEPRVHLSDIMKKSVQNGERFIVEKAGVPTIAIISSADCNRFIRERDVRFEMLDRLKSKVTEIPQAEKDEDIRIAIQETRKLLLCDC